MASIESVALDVADPTAADRFRTTAFGCAHEYGRRSTARKGKVISKPGYGRFRRTARVKRRLGVRDCR
jgi:hypothetical protein